MCHAVPAPPPHTDSISNILELIVDVDFCVPDLPSMRPTDPISPTALDDDDGESQSSVIPIYCAILGLVVFILLLYVIVRNCRRQKQPGHKKVPMYSAQEASMFDSMGGQKQGSDSGVCMEQDPRPGLWPLQVYYGPTRIFLGPDWSVEVWPVTLKR